MPGPIIKIQTNKALLSLSSTNEKNLFEISSFPGKADEVINWEDFYTALKKDIDNKTSFYIDVLKEPGLLEDEQYPDEVKTYMGDSIRESREELHKVIKRLSDSEEGYDNFLFLNDNGESLKSQFYQFNEKCESLVKGVFSNINLEMKEKDLIEIDKSMSVVTSNFIGIRSNLSNFKHITEAQEEICKKYINTQEKELIELYSNSHNFNGANGSKIFFEEDNFMKLLSAYEENKVKEAKEKGGFGDIATKVFKDIFKDKCEKRTEDTLRAFGVTFENSILPDNAFSTDSHIFSALEDKIKRDEGLVFVNRKTVPYRKAPKEKREVCVLAPFGMDGFSNQMNNITAGLINPRIEKGYTPDYVTFILKQDHWVAAYLKASSENGRTKYDMYFSDSKSSSDRFNSVKQKFSGLRDFPLGQSYDLSPKLPQQTDGHSCGDIAVDNMFKIAKSQLDRGASASSGDYNSVELKKKYTDLELFALRSHLKDNPTINAVFEDQLFGKQTTELERLAIMDNESNYSQQPSLEEPGSTIYSHYSDVDLGYHETKEDKKEDEKIQKADGNPLPDKTTSKTKQTFSLEEKRLKILKEAKEKELKKAQEELIEPSEEAPLPEKEKKELLKYNEKKSDAVSEGINVVFKPLEVALGMVGAVDIDNPAGFVFAFVMSSVGAVSSVAMSPIGLYQSYQSYGSANKMKEKLEEKEEEQIAYEDSWSKYEKDAVNIRTLKKEIVDISARKRKYESLNVLNSQDNEELNELKKKIKLLKETEPNNTKEKDSLPEERLEEKRNR